MHLDIFKKLAHYPFILNNERYDSELLPQHRNCLKCKELECYERIKEGHIDSFVCEKGYNNIAVRLNSNLFVFNGVILKSNKVVRKDRKEARKLYIVDDKELVKHIELLQELDKTINKEISQNLEQNFSLFHDIKTTYNLVISSTQNYIQSQEGKRFEEKLSNCPQEIIDLYDSLELVNSQLGMIDIIINPQTILQGSKKPINIYRLFHKISQLFSNRFENKIEKENKEIRWYVKDKITVPDTECYDSIELIPIILIDNAIKYSLQNSKIVIAYEVLNDKIMSTVTSYGPVVKDENTDKIFEKNQRGENAQEFTNKGIGMGLWVAANILKHHNSQITYSKEKVNNGIGLNKFSFYIPIE